MLVIFTICLLVLVFAYEIRHRMAQDHFNQLDNDTQRLDLEIKKIKEELAKKQDAEIKKAFKLPFMP